MYQSCVNQARKWKTDIQKRISGVRSDALGLSCPCSSLAIQSGVDERRTVDKAYGPAPDTIVSDNVLTGGSSGSTPIVARSPVPDDNMMQLLGQMQDIDLELEGSTLRLYKFASPKSAVLQSPRFPKPVLKVEALPKPVKVPTRRIRVSRRYLWGTSCPEMEVMNENEQPLFSRAVTAEWAESYNEGMSSCTPASASRQISKETAYDESPHLNGSHAACSDQATSSDHAFSRLKPAKLQDVILSFQLPEGPVLSTPKVEDDGNLAEVSEHQTLSPRPALERSGSMPLSPQSQKVLMAAILHNLKENFGSASESERENNTT